MTKLNMPTTMKLTRHLRSARDKASGPLQPLIGFPRLTDSGSLARYQVQAGAPAPGSNQEVIAVEARCARQKSDKEVIAVPETDTCLSTAEPVLSPIRIDG